jgi:hypothetical protein
MKKFECNAVIGVLSFTKLTPAWKGIKMLLKCSRFVKISAASPAKVTHLEIFMPGFSGVNPIFASEAPPAASGLLVACSKNAHDFFLSILNFFFLYQQLTFPHSSLAGSEPLRRAANIFCSIMSAQETAG